MVLALAGLLVQGLGFGVCRSRANVAYVRQSRSDSGLEFQVKLLEPFELTPLRSEATHSRKRMFIERMRLDHKLMASKEGSKLEKYGT